MKKETQQELFYAGFPSFVGSDYVEIKDTNKYDVAVIGIPIDEGASYREGAKMAPRVIRQYSAWKRFEQEDCYDYDHRAYLPVNSLRICDTGDVNIFKGNTMKTFADVIEKVSEIRKNTFPVILGGDHSITYASYIGVKKGGNYKKLGLIQFDAHNDTEPDDEHLPDICHSNQFTHLINEGYLDGKNMLTIGLRGFVDRRWHDFAVEKGIDIITANEFNQMDNERIIDIIKDKFKDCDGVYVTFDMDSLEAAYSEGVGTPKYNGINAMKTIEILRELKQINVVGFDVVELCPVYDTTGITAFMAWEVLNNFLSFGFRKEK